MIANDDELKAMMDRISRLQQMVIQVRESSSSLENYRASAGGFLAEIDRMMLEVREYLWAPGSLGKAAQAA